MLSWRIFEDQVLAFNEKRKNKIGSELNKRSCEINDIKKKIGMTQETKKDYTFAKLVSMTW